MAGIPPGSIEAVLATLRSSPEPLRRRKLLAALEARGHRISLAGLNRILEHCVRNQLVVDTSDGLRPTTSPRDARDSTEGNATPRS